VKFLVDTSALLALAMRDDRYHESAVRFVRQSPSVRFLLSDLILAETATRVRARSDAGRAVALARSLLDSRRYEVVFVDGDLLGDALTEMLRYADKPLSLTDCVSFAIMRRLRLQAAFTFDRDFRDCGLGMVP